MKSWVSILAVLFAVIAIAPAAAQETTESTLLPNTPVESSITDAGSASSWTFYALKDDVFSFAVRAAGSFDPVLTIRNDSGIAIISNDDYAYPDSHDALLEAITIPRTGDYEVVVTGFGESTGGFTLTMLPGYAQPAIDERFTSLEGWDVDDALSPMLEDGFLSVSLAGISERGLAVDQETEPLADFHADLEVESVEGQNGWNVGLALRYQENGDHYLVIVSSEGLWRMIVVEDDVERIVRDWTAHPAIVPGEQSFRVGVLANGRGFDVFYNGQFVGRAVDESLMQPGQVGVGVVTANAVGSALSATLDGLLVTVPLEVNGEIVFPKQLVQGAASVIVEELERRHVIPAGGQMQLTLDESFVENTSPGVNRLLLGRGTLVYQNFVMHSTAILQPFGDGLSACGILVRHVDNTDYTVAYLDNAGGYGVSQRKGDTFLPGAFRDDAGWDATAENELLVVVNSDVLHYFVNNHHAATMEIEPVEGEVGNVIINFDPMSATCRFVDTWVWQWE